MGKNKLNILNFFLMFIGCYFLLLCAQVAFVTFFVFLRDMGPVGPYHYLAIFSAAFVAYIYCDRKKKREKQWKKTR